MARYDIAGLQYEDDAGNPLVEGKLYFYESGTTTQLTTYSDIDETVANAHPVPLSAAGRAPDIYFSGDAKLIITDANDVQIGDPKDPVTGTGSAGGRVSFAAWNSLSTYSEGNFVTASNGLYYVCIATSSQGNEPSATAADWSQIKFTGLWNTNQDYVIGDVVQGSSGDLFKALVAQSGNDPESDFTNWAQMGLTVNGTQKLKKGADVASATALALGDDGNAFDITGTTAITSIDAIGVGTNVTLQFDGILTLTHHATDLILPTGANITTAAGGYCGVLRIRYW